MNAKKYGYDVKTIRTNKWLKSDRERRKIKKYQLEKEENIEIIKSNFIKDLSDNKKVVLSLKNIPKAILAPSFINFYTSLSTGIKVKDIAVYLKENYLGSPNTKKLQKISRSYKYFMADASSDWKVNITKEFPNDSEFTPDEILSKLQMIQNLFGTYDKSIGKIVTKTKATHLLGELKLIKRFQKRDGDQRINVYKIIGDNPMGFIPKPKYSLSYV